MHDTVKIKCPDCGEWVDFPSITTFSSESTYHYPDEMPAPIVLAELDGRQEHCSCGKKIIPVVSIELRLSTY